MANDFDITPFNLFSSLNDNADREAFFINNTSYSYASLRNITFAISDAIEKAGGSKSGVIAIASYDAIETYASILACWYSGYAYVPLNPENPAMRNDSIINQSLADVLLEGSLPAQGKVFTSVTIKKINTSALPQLDCGRLELKNTKPGQIAYILFTSGSTGIPKGVPISHQNLSAFIDGYNSTGIAIGKEDKVLQMFDLSFDVSVASFLLPLLGGAAVYTVPIQGIKYLNVYKILSRQSITVASLVPSLLMYLQPYFPEIKIPSLRVCILTAEASNTQLVEAWKDCIPNAAIYNLYGPTECTIWCTWYKYAAAPKSYNEMLAIGRNFEGVSTIIWSDEGKEADEFEKGELLLCGKQLTEGYLNNAALNAAAFININGKLFYRTGDLCFKDGEGCIVYCGRKDYQVKIQGHRIELSEIEMVANKVSGINCIVVADKNESGINELHLFAEGANRENSNLKKQLSENLPHYMVPAFIHSVMQLPVNASGKIDRKHLQSLIKKGEA